MNARTARTSKGTMGRKALLAVAVVAAGLGAGLAAGAPAGAATTCSPTALGNTGWTGNLGTDSTNGWTYTPVNPSGVPLWYNSNDTAIDQALTHTVTGAPATGAVVTFDAFWRQATVGGGPSAQTATANLQVFFGGTLYATISTPGPNNPTASQRATVVAANGATISPAYPSRASGWSGTTLSTFTLTLPNGVPATGPLSFEMSYSVANGAGTNGAADDFGVGNVSVTECVTTTADLSVTKTGPATVRPGSTVSWDVTVANAGPDAASTWTLTDAVPAGVTNVSVSGAGCSVSGSTVTCTGTSLAAGATRNVTITGTAPDVTSSTTLHNVATVSSPDDTNSANNTDDADTSVDPEVGTPVVDPAVAAAALGGVALVGFGVSRRRRVAA